MKTIKHLLVTLYITLISIYHSFCQTKDEDTKNEKCKSERDTILNIEVFKTVDIYPTPEIGMLSLLKKIGKTLKVERLPNSKNLALSDLKMYVGFIVNEDGEIIGERVIKFNQSHLLQEVTFESIIQTLKTEKWSVGKCKGKNVPVFLILPINVRLG